MARQRAATIRFLAQTPRRDKRRLLPRRRDARCAPADALGLIVRERFCRMIMMAAYARLLDESRAKAASAH